MRRGWPLASAVLALAAAGCGGPPPQVPDRAPGQVRMGVHVRAVSDQQADRIARGGARLVRTTLQWAQVEPRQGRGYDWHLYDRLMDTTASRGLGFLPVLIGTPAWAGAGPPQPPRPGAMPAFMHFVRSAVERYGPGGEFWREHPELRPKPIRAWQVWNEPNLPAFWATPDPAAYAALLRQVGHTIRSVDPDAKIVLAGMPRSVVRYPVDRYLADLYELPGFSRLFDVVAVHAYESDAARLVSLVDDTRRLMDQAGDAGKPIWVTEFGWGSAGPVRDTVRVKTPAIQADLLGRSVSDIRRAAGRSGVQVLVWYDLQDYSRPASQPDRFSWHTGLFGSDGTPKPAWDAFAQAAGGRPGRGSLPGK